MRFKKFCKVPRKTYALESLFNKFADLKLHNTYFEERLLRTTSDLPKLYFVGLKYVCFEYATIYKACLKTWNQQFFTKTKLTPKKLKVAVQKSSCLFKKFSYPIMWSKQIRNPERNYEVLILVMFEGFSLQLYY